VREVTLIGQNVNAYHGEAADGSAATLGRLLRRLAQVPGIARLRYTTSHPNDMDDDLIAAHADLAELMPYVHLPVQSGADRILAAMNRKHTRQHYLDVVARLRAARPDLAFSSDFHRPASGRDGAGLPEHPRSDRDRRLRRRLHLRLFAAAGHPGRRTRGSGAGGGENPAPLRPSGPDRRQQRDFNASFVGRTLPLLLEKPGRLPGQLVGKSHICRQYR